MHLMTICLFGSQLYGLIIILKKNKNNKIATKQGVDSNKLLHQPFSIGFEKGFKSSLTFIWDNFRLTVAIHTEWKTILILQVN